VAEVIQPLESTPSTTALTGDSIKELLVPLLLGKHDTAKAKRRLEGADWQAMATALNEMQPRYQQQLQQINRHATIIEPARALYATLQRYQAANAPFPVLGLIREIDAALPSFDPHWATDERGHLNLRPWVLYAEEALVIVTALLQIAYPGRKPGQRANSPLVLATVALLQELGFHLTEGALAKYLEPRRRKRRQ